MHSQENRIYKRMALQDMLTGLLSRAGVFDAVRSLRLSDHYAVLSTGSKRRTTSTATRQATACCA